MAETDRASRRLRVVTLCDESHALCARARTTVAIAKHAIADSKLLCTGSRERLAEARHLQPFAEPACS